MKEEYRKYIAQLYQYIPSEIYEGLFSLFCLGVVMYFAFCGFKKGILFTVRLMLVEYLFLIFCSTVFYRTSGVERKYDLQPFWSYDKPELMVENVMNVVVFVPIGILLGWAFQKIKWWQVLIVGSLISLSIEVMQFGLKRGFAETDDVMHNTLGCMLGYGVFLIIQGLWRNVLSNKRVEG